LVVTIPGSGVQGHHPQEVTLRVVTDDYVETEDSWGRVKRLGFKV